MLKENTPQHPFKCPVSAPVDLTAYLLEKSSYMLPLHPNSALKLLASNECLTSAFDVVRTADIYHNAQTVANLFHFDSFSKKVFGTV